MMATTSFLLGVRFLYSAQAVYAPGGAGFAAAAASFNAAAANLMG